MEKLSWIRHRSSINQLFYCGAVVVYWISYKKESITLPTSPCRKKVAKKCCYNLRQISLIKKNPIYNKFVQSKYFELNSVKPSIQQHQIMGIHNQHLNSFTPPSTFVEPFRKDWTSKPLKIFGKGKFSFEFIKPFLYRTILEIDPYRLHRPNNYEFKF